MPRISQEHTLVDAQNLPADKAKELLNFVLARCYENDDLYKAVHAGLKILQKQEPKCNT